MNAVSTTETERFTQAIVRRPGNSLIKGITTANLGKPDIDLATRQHNAYIDCLSECGVNVTILDADERFPDSVFIEDTAIVTDKVAIISRPAPPTRQKETEDVANILVELFPYLETIEEPGTLEGGDVLRIGDTFYVGVSERTNRAGADQLIGILESYGYLASKVSMRHLLHLKTGVSYVGDHTIVVCKALSKEKRFKPYSKIIVSDEELYAANCIRVNDSVLVSSGFPETSKQLSERGFTVRVLDMSEFRKVDGGLSCLSLRF